MSREKNELKWKGDPRSKEDRIREARGHVNTRSQRRNNAELLQKERVKLSPEQQIQKLDERLGKNYGAKKERTRLTANSVQDSSGEKNIQRNGKNASN